EDIASTAPPPLYDDSGEPADAEEIAGVPLSDTTAPAQPRRQEIASRTENERPAPARREEPDPPPAPVATSNNGQGGPVSLRPGDAAAPGTTSAPTTAPASNPPPVQIASTQPASTPPPTTTRATPRGQVVWAQRPSARRIGELYPSRALREGVGGRVELSCSVRTNQTLACNIASESPSGLGFGQAALNASTSYRASPTLSDGSGSAGSQTRIVVQFQAPSQ
ncbi:MAG TPA: hypothetical protein VFO00_05520, partial [Vitreimonas sp.]|nr:hypothetical protein [Vitreimonas sp.]